MTSLSIKSAGLGELGERTLRKVRRRVMPLIVLLYFVAYLDRNNVGFAKLTMSEDIGLNAAAYGLGAGIFFLGYALLEVPSNAGMYRFGARKWLARILITWGIFATAMCLVNGETTYYIIRFLLGAAEAGFFPAILFYLTLWFPAAQRVTVLGIFILAQPVSNALGAPVSGLLLQMDGIMGLQGWQWLYIIEGIPAILLGLLTPILMTDRPRDAKWLNTDEREWLATTMEQGTGRQVQHRQPQLPGRPEGQAHPGLLGPLLRTGLRHLRTGPVDAHDRRRHGQRSPRPQIGFIVLHPLRRGRRFCVLLEQARGPDRQARLAHRREHGAGRHGPAGRRIPAARSTRSWP